MNNLHKQFVSLGRQRRKLIFELLKMPPEIYKSKIYLKYSPTIFEYAGRYGGLSYSSVEKRLRIEKHIHNKPLLKEAIKEVGVNKVSLIATLVTSENEEQLVEKVTNMSQEAIRQLSKEMRQPEKPKVNELEALFEQAKQQDPEKLTRLLREFVKPITGEKSRYVKKQESECTYPNCTKKAEHNHHPHRYSETKNHQNLKPLCKVHHEFMHNGIIQNETYPPEYWRIHLRTPTNKADLLYRKYRSQALKL